MAVFFMSTSGIAVYKHYCNQDKIVQSYFLMPNDDCDVPEMVEEEGAHDCCHSDDMTQMHDDCCSHNMEFYQINSDLIVHDFKVEITKNITSTPVNGLTLIVDVSEQKENTVRPIPPPSLTTPQRLSLYQTYLI